MTSIQEDALGLALIACSIGVLVSRAEIAFTRRQGIYQNPANYAAKIRLWTKLAWTFGVAAALIALAWIGLSLTLR